MEIAFNEQGIPNTFVPGRNLVFLTAAAALAWRKGVRHLVMGVCETDFSGYPDCRDDTIKAMQVALNLGMDSRFVVHTPLMWLDKADTWDLAEREGGAPFVEAVRTVTHTCYLGDRADLHPWGYGCGECRLPQAPPPRGWREYASRHRGLRRKPIFRLPPPSRRPGEMISPAPHGAGGVRSSTDGGADWGYVRDACGNSCSRRS